MRKTLAALAIVTLAPLPALAESSCGSMLMPAAQLKQVSRGLSRGHSGLDLMAPYGSPLRAAAPGTVVFAGPYFAYGYIVDIQHGDGVITRYAHMAGFAPGIRPGATVAAGDVLGQVGTSGRAHGPHVHFEVRIGGQAVDPKPYLDLAACTSRTPTVRIEEARAPGVSAPGRPQLTRATADRRDTLDLASVRRANPPVNARPGGLLD